MDGRLASSVAPSLVGSPPENRQTIRRCIRGEKIGNGTVCPFGATKKINRPFCDALFANVNIHTAFGLVDVLPLKHKGKRLFSARCPKGKCLRGFAGSKSVVVVAAVYLIWRATLWMKPYPILQYGIPDVAAASLCKSRISAVVKYFRTQQ